MHLPPHPLLIAGSGRSGTTWLLDSLSKANNLRTIFEPLHPVGVPIVSSYSSKFICEENDNPKLKEFFSLVFSGSYTSLWTDYRIRPDRLRLQALGLYNMAANYKRLFIHYNKYRLEKKRERCIVKCIRANLMLGWLYKNFQPRTILLLRHPGAVIASKLKLGGEDWDFRPALQAYLADSSLMKKYDKEFQQVLTNNLSPVMAHTIIWCIENLTPVSMEESSHLYIAFFENLITRGGEEWERVTNALGLSVVPGPEILNKPSQQASREMRDDTSRIKQPQKWVSHFTTEELRQMQEILDLFKVTFYSAFEPSPLIKRH